MRARCVLYSGRATISAIDRCRQPGTFLTWQNRWFACSSVGSGWPLKGSAAKFGRPSLVTSMTARRTACAIQNVSMASGSEK